MDRDHGTALLPERAQAHGAVAGPRRLANRAAGRGRVSARGRCDVFRERPRQDSTSGARSARRTSGCSARTRASSSLPSAEGRESRPRAGHRATTSSALWRRLPARPTARRATSASSSRSLRRVVSSGEPGHWTGRSRPSPAATKASASTLCSCQRVSSETVAELGDDWKAEHSHRAARRTGACSQDRFRKPQA